MKGLFTNFVLKITNKQLLSLYKDLKAECVLQVHNDSSSFVLLN